MLWLSRKDIEHISRRLLRDYLKKVPQKVDHIDPADFAEKMCGLQFTFADISEAHDAIGLTATSGVIITIPQRDGTRLDYELDGKTAFIDQSLVAENQIGRLNFTMMHEAAHQLFWMLYPEEYEAQTPRCVFRMTDEHKEAPLIVFKISLTTLASRLCRRWLNSIPFALSKHTITVIDSPPSSFHRCSQTQINSMSTNIIADNRENYN